MLYGKAHRILNNALFIYNSLYLELVIIMINRRYDTQRFLRMYFQEIAKKNAKHICICFTKRFQNNYIQHFILITIFALRIKSDSLYV